MEPFLLPESLPQLDAVPPAELPQSIEWSAMASATAFAAKHRSGEGLPVVLRGAVRKESLGNTLK